MVAREFVGEHERNPGTGIEWIRPVLLENEPVEHGDLRDRDEVKIELHIDCIARCPVPVSVEEIKGVLNCRNSLHVDTVEVVQVIGRRTGGLKNRPPLAVRKESPVHIDRGGYLGKVRAPPYLDAVRLLGGAETRRGRGRDYVDQRSERVDCRREESSRFAGSPDPEVVQPAGRETVEGLHVGRLVPA